MNVITVIAGNYQMKGESGRGGVADHNGSARRPTMQRPFCALPTISRLLSRIPKTIRWRSTTIRRHAAARRCGRRPGRGGDAHARRCGCDSIGGARRPVRRGGRPRVGACGVRRSPVVHAPAWHRNRSAAHPPQLGVQARAVFLGRANRSGGEQVVVLGTIVARQSCSAPAPIRSARKCASGTSRSAWSAWWRAPTGRRPARSATISSTRCTCRSRPCTGCSISPSSTASRSPRDRSGRRRRVAAA